MFQNTAFMSKENTYQSKYLELREINEISKLFLKCQCSKKSKGGGVIFNCFINLCWSIKYYKNGVQSGPI